MPRTQDVPFARPAESAPVSRGASLGRRVISTAILLPLFVWMVVAGPAWLFGAVLVLVAAIAQWEFTGMFERAGFATFRWLGLLGGALVTAPAAAGDAIFVGTTLGEVWRLDPKSGEVAQRWTVGGPVRSQPVIEGGWIYVGTENGRLVGIDTKNPEFTGWATWGGDAARTAVHKMKK